MAGSVKELAKYRYERALEKLKNVMEMREHADYDDFFLASKTDTEEQISRAEQFLGYVKVYLKDKEII